MNRTFKTIWSSVRNQYIVADEKRAARTKSNKATVTAVVLGLSSLFCVNANAADVPPALASGASPYAEKGVLGDASSWESAEYKDDWGLAGMNASQAYALGFNGAGVHLGVMDSGALLSAHPDLSGERFHAVHSSGTYGSTGVRYPQDPYSQFNPNYKKGEAFDVTGEWVLNVNDSHGTHVAGTVGGNRDGVKFHGVAWGADVHVGNTGGSDDTNYGPFLDHDFFLAGWSAIVQDITAANAKAGQADRGGVINNSFGTNIRVEKNGSYGKDGYNTAEHFPVNTTEQTEYEYFLFNRIYGPDKSFVDAAWEAVRHASVVQVMTTGNRDMAHPYYRALYPYFNPEAEGNWIAVAGLKTENGADGKTKYALAKNYNEAGNAKWWTVSAPGVKISSAAVVDGSYIKPGKDEGDGKKLSDPTYATWSGTSMAAPHVTGAMGVLMSRYPDMNALQVRDILFTTASHTNPDGSVMDGWASRDGKLPAEGEVSERMGWGVPDLKKGMYGPGQLLGRFDYDLREGSLDVWSNDIGEAALHQRQREDAAWKAAAEKWLKNPTLKLADGYTAEEKQLLGEVLLDTKDDIVGLDSAKEKISETDAIAWRKAYYEKRLQAIAERAYNGSLVKRGGGTLVLTGNNTYEGGTTVEAGTLWGFNDSFGAALSDPRAPGNGKVVVKGGALGVMKTYQDRLTGRGELKNTDSAHSVDILVKEGATYLLSAGEDVEVGALAFEKGAFIAVGSPNADVIKSALEGAHIKSSVTAEKLTGKAAVKPDYAFFDAKIRFEENRITSNLKFDKAAFSAYGATANARKVGRAVGEAGRGALFDAILLGTKDDVTRTFDSIGNDAFLNAGNAALVNAVTLARAVKDQAQGAGAARVAPSSDGSARIWATGIGTWGEADYGGSRIDNDFYAGLFGAEVDVSASAKVGAFFGAGTSKFDGGKAGKLESDDLHFGLYAQTNVLDALGLSVGFAYTRQDRDGQRTLTVGSNSAQNKISNDAQIAQLFAEAAYKGFNTKAFSVEPYAGVTWLRMTGDDFSEKAGRIRIETENPNRNVEMTTLGVRGALPFSVGSAAMSLKGDLNWMHFFGDTSPQARLGLGGSGAAVLSGGKLDNMIGVGVGLEAALAKTATFGLSYTGAYDGDLSSSGLFANLRWAF